MRHPRKPAGTAVIIAALVSLVLTACSSSGSKHPAAASSGAGSGANGTSSTGGTTANGTPIEVGVVCTCSGLSGTGDLATKPYRAWANDVNANGGLNGHPVKLNIKDDAANPATAVAAVKSLISNKVAVIVDSSLVDNAWQSLITESGPPVVGANFDSPFFTNPLFFPAVQTGDTAVYSIVASAKAAGSKAFGNMYCAEAVVCKEFNNGIIGAGKGIGLDVPYTAAFSSTAPNFTAQCIAMKNAKVDATNIGATNTDFIKRILRDCAQQGFHPRFISLASNAYSSAFTTAENLKDDSWLAFATIPSFVGQQNAAAERANAAIEKSFPGLLQSKDFYAATYQAWAAALLLEHAIKASGLTESETLSADLVRKGLYALNGDDLGGFLPVKIKFEPGKPHRIACWFLAHIKDGQQTLANDGKPICQPGGPPVQ